MAQAGQESGKVFYGWWVVLAAGVGLCVHSAPIILFTFGVFLKSFNQEFGWSRAQISLAISFSTLGVTAAVLFLGRLVDRFGARRVILPAVLLFGLSVLSLSFLSAHLWHFYAIFLVMGVVGSGTTPVPYSKVISRWFDRRRGLALGLAAVGSPIGGFIMPSLAQALITAVGFFCGSALGTFLLWSGTVGGVAFVAAVLVGLGQGAELDILPYAVSRYFGLRTFGEIYGYTFAAVGLGAAVGPLLMGVGFAATGSYGLVLGTFVAATLTAAGLMTGLGPYRVWEPAVEPVVTTGVSRA